MGFRMINSNRWYWKDGKELREYEERQKKLFDNKSSNKIVKAKKVKKKVKKVISYPAPGSKAYNELVFTLKHDFFVPDSVIKGKSYPELLEIAKECE